MGIVLIVLGVTLIAFVDYCCCKAASLAEQRTESMPQKNRVKGKSKD